MPETNKSSQRISPKKLSNLKVVVLCIAAATTFWILNALNKDDYTTVVDFPVEISFDQNQYIAVASLPNTLEIEIAGNGWDLLRKYFNFNSDAYPIELNNPADKKYIPTSDLKRSLGEFLSPTQLVSILEDSLKFQVDRIKTLKVKPVLDSASFSMAKNYRIMEQINFSPESLTLQGPSSIIDTMSRTFPITLNENRLSKSVNKKIELEMPGPLSELVKIDEKEIDIKFEVVEFLEGNKRLRINKTHFPSNVTLADEDVIIMISYLVDERKVAELKEVEFEAVLDYYKRNKEDSTIQVQVKPQPKYLDQIVVTPPILRLRYD